MITTPSRQTLLKTAGAAALGLRTATGAGGAGAGWKYLKKRLEEIRKTYQ
jgi:hypothetical protein